MKNNPLKPLLQLSEVERHFPTGDSQVTVLKDINLTIYAGEMVAIMGQSGSGKSTLMNILGCLDRPSSGRYLVDGRNTSQLQSDELAALRRNYFGFIFQRYHLLPHLSAEANVEIPAIYAGVDKKKRQQRAQTLLKRLGLEDRITHRPNQLSGGQQQRVSIARALMNGGEVILADEPTGALDSQSGKEVMNVLRELHHHGHTIIIVTHDKKIANNAERIIEICDGKIIADYPSREGDHSTLTTSPDDPITLSSADPARFQSNWARFAEAFRMAWIALNAHRLRTLLTMLGIIIGIASVVSVIALGQGAQQAIVNQINALGTNTVSINPGKDWGDEKAGMIHTLISSDLTLLEAQPYIDSVSPVIIGSKTLRYKNTRISAAIKGVNEQYIRIRRIKLATGTTFSTVDTYRQAQVAIIDANTRDKLFKPWDNPVGKIIFIGRLPVKVIAVTTKQDNSLLGDPTTLEVLVPYTTAMRRLFGQNHFTYISLRVREGQPNHLVEQSITKLLTVRHGIKDFFTQSSDAIIKRVKQTTTTFTLFISAIAVITLVVGGIGVMNIMLVSVTERTREIGIRLAIGARQHDIMQQFLIEAIVVCLLGGVIGIALSFGVGILFSFFIKLFSMKFSVLSITIACLCSTLVGLLFGFLPARNAAQLDPVEALARE